MQEKEFDMIRQIMFKMQIYGVESGIYTLKEILREGD